MGSNRNAEARHPATAPAVLAPKMPALTRSSRQAEPIIRSSAVSVPPMAMVAGSSTSIGSAKLADHSTMGAGSGPSSGANQRPAAGSSSTQIRPQTPITVSSSA